MALLKRCVTGLCLKDDGPELLAPSQAVQYASCHDNHTLWDRLHSQVGSGDYDDAP